MKNLIKKGSLVRHKLSGQSMEVINIGEVVAVTKLIHEPKDRWSIAIFNFDYRHAVCILENLELIK